MSRDPIGQSDQVNLYRYVRNSPLMGTDRDGKKAKQLIGNAWNGYLNGSQQFGSDMYDTYSENKAGIIAAVDRTREYSGNVGLIATPFLFFPPTTPIAAGIIGVTGGMVLGAGALESYVTQDKKYAVDEGISFLVGKFGGGILQKYLKNAGAITKVDYNTSVGRYMGQYANGAYGFVKNEIGQASVMVSAGTEQVLGGITQKLWGK